MLFLSKLFTGRQQVAVPRLSKMAREATLAHLKREAAANVDPERAAELARAKLASLGVELSP